MAAVVYVRMSIAVSGIVHVLMVSMLHHSRIMAFMNMLMFVFLGMIMLMPMIVFVVMLVCVSLTMRMGVGVLLFILMLVMGMFGILHFVVVHFSSFGRPPQLGGCIQ